MTIHYVGQNVREYIVIEDGDGNRITPDSVDVIIGAPNGTETTTPATLRDDDSYYFDIFPTTHGKWRWRVETDDDTYPGAAKQGFIDVEKENVS